MEELDIRETLNLATIKVRKSFSLVMQSLFYSNNSLRNFQTFVHKDRLLIKNGNTIRIDL